MVRDLVRRRHIYHVSMTVERCDGSFRWAGAAGQADATGVPMQIDTPFYIVSITKMYIATLVLQLVERKVIGIDELLVSYLPVSLTAGLHRYRGTDYTSEITLRHLLAHTSGLPDCLEEHSAGRASVIERVVQEGGRLFSREELLHIVRYELTAQPDDALQQRARYSRDALGRRSHQ
jgi:D-alanyl-D-alanine carboxypeptidase